MDLQGFDRLRLSGDEDGGVGLDCRDCWDGGRPLAYLTDGYNDGYAADEKVAKVRSIVDVLAVGRAHLDEHHRSS